MRPPAVAQIENGLARAVTRELGLGSVGIEDPQVCDVEWILRAGDLKDAVCVDAEVTFAQPPDAGGREREGKLLLLDDHVVVAKRLPLLKSHIQRSW